MVLRGQKLKTLYIWLWVKPSEHERLSLRSWILVLFKNILHRLKRKNSSCKRCHINGVLAHPCFSVDFLIYTLAGLSWSKASAFLQMINGTYLKCLEITCFKVRHRTSSKTERRIFYTENFYKSVVSILDLWFPSQICASHWPKSVVHSCHKDSRLGLWWDQRGELELEKN